MLQRGLLTIAEKQQQLQQQQQQQQQQTPYDTSKATTTHETNLLREQEDSSLKNRNKQELNENYKERMHCLPIIELPQIKIEQDVEYMEEGIEEEEQQQQHETEQRALNREKQQNIDLVQAKEGAEEELSIKPVVPQLLEPTSILKTSLLTGAANTLATLTAAAEQIARMPNESVTKSYTFLKEENKRTYALEEEGKKSGLAKDKSINTAAAATTTYTSILQTALMSKRPATLNVAATSTTPSSFKSTKSLHVRTPDQVLKTAVTLATLGEIAAQQEQQQQLQLHKHQQQQQQQQQHHQQPHILVVPQVQRKMCTLPFKKLNFANLTTTSASASNNNAATNCTTPSTAISAAATNTTITNNYLGSNLKTNTNLTNSSCISNTNNLAASSASNKRDKLETTTATTFFDTNHIINNGTICSSNNNSNKNNIYNYNASFKSQTMATQTLKIPTVKPQLVTTQTQTEETSTQTSASASSIMKPLSLATTSTISSASSLQTASSGSSGSGLLRTAVSNNTKLLTQNSSTSPSSTYNSLLANKFLTKTNLEAHEQRAATNVANNVMGNIFKHVSDNNNTSTMAKMNVIQQNNNVAVANTNTNIGSQTVASENATNSASTTANVTVVVFETLLPED